MRKQFIGICKIGVNDPIYNCSTIRNTLGKKGKIWEVLTRRGRVKTTQYIIVPPLETLYEIKRKMSEFLTRRGRIKTTQYI